MVGESLLVLHHIASLYLLSIRLLHPRGIEPLDGITVLSSETSTQMGLSFGGCELLRCPPPPPSSVVFVHFLTVLSIFLTCLVQGSVDRY